MIVLRNVDGTLAAVDNRERFARQYVVIDEEILPRAPLTVGAFTREIPPMYTRNYTRTRRLFPDPRTDHGIGTRPIWLYEELTSPREMAPAQRAARLPQVEKAIGDMLVVANALRAAMLTDRAAEGARAIARDAWLEGRLADARTILLHGMSDTQALATVQGWLAEAWRDLAAPNQPHAAPEPAAEAPAR